MMIIINNNSITKIDFIGLVVYIKDNVVGM